MMRKMRIQKIKATAVILSMLFLFLCMYGIKAKAMDVASQTYEGVTYTGSITYYGVSGPSGYYRLELRANRASMQLYESVTLKSGTGQNKDTVAATAQNSTIVAAQTPTFAGNVYTTHGYYYYAVINSAGHEHTFNVTR